MHVSFVYVVVIVNTLLLGRITKMPYANPRTQRCDIDVGREIAAINFRANANRTHMLHTNNSTGYAQSCLMIINYKWKSKSVSNHLNDYLLLLQYYC